MRDPNDAGTLNLISGRLLPSYARLSTWEQDLKGGGFTPSQSKETNMHLFPRRHSLCQLLAVSGLGAASLVQAQSVPAHVDKGSDQAVALGYLHDSANTDAKKYPQHTPTQRCRNCSCF